MRCSAAFFLLLGASLIAGGCAHSKSLPHPSYDLILRGGTIYDGSGGKPYVGDVAIDGDRIVALDHLPALKASVRSTPAGWRSRLGSSTC